MHAFISCLVVCLVASVNMSCPCGNFNPLSVKGRVAFFLSLLHNHTAVSRLDIDSPDCSLSGPVTLGIFLSCPFSFAFHDPANASTLALSLSLYVGEYHTHTYLSLPLLSQHKKDVISASLYTKAISLQTSKDAALLFNLCMITVM